MKFITISLLSLFIQTNYSFGQSLAEDIKIIEAISNFRDCYALCFQDKNISSDSETYRIIKIQTKNKSRFKKTLSRLSFKLPNLSQHFSKIRNISSDSSWNVAIKNWSHSLPNNKINCEYKLSISRPLTLSSDNSILVIITSYKYEADSFTFEALVYFYHLQKIEGKYIVTGSDHVYDILYDWRMY